MWAWAKHQSKAHPSPSPGGEPSLTSAMQALSRRSRGHDSILPARSFLRACRREGAREDGTWAGRERGKVWDTQRTAQLLDHRPESPRCPCPL